jgi:hypothetical protein
VVGGGERGVSVYYFSALHCIWGGGENMERSGVGWGRVGWVELLDTLVRIELVVYYPLASIDALGDDCEFVFLPFVDLFIQGSVRPAVFCRNKNQYCCLSGYLGIC